MHSGNHQFERFTKGEQTSEFDRNYDESMSHKCVIEALSRLSNMKLIHVCKDKRIPLNFEFRTVEKTPYLHLPNGAKYYPDILCTFGEDSEFYDKWGGKLAIEVTYTHGCESYKKEDFVFHNIPVFEVTIKNNSARQFPAERPNWPKGKLWDEELVEQHINQLVTWFHEDVVGEFIVDPTSTRVHEQRVCKLNNNISYLKSENANVKNELELLHAKHTRVADELHEHKKENSTLLKRVQNYQSAYENLQSEISQMTDELESYKGNANETKEKFNKYDEKLSDYRRKVDFQKNGLYALAFIIILFLISPLLTPKVTAQVLNSWYTSLINLRQLFS